MKHRAKYYISIISQQKKYMVFCYTIYYGHQHFIIFISTVIRERLEQTCEIILGHQL